MELSAKLAVKYMHEEYTSELFRKIKEEKERRFKELKISLAKSCKYYLEIPYWWR